MRKFPREILWIAGLTILMMLVVFAVQDSPTDKEQEYGQSFSSFSTGAGGLNAFYLVLDELGYDPQRLFLPFTRETLPTRGSIVLANSEDDVRFKTPAPAELDALIRWIKTGHTLVLLSDTQITHTKSVSKPQKNFFQDSFQKPVESMATPCQPTALAHDVKHITVMSDIRLVLPDSNSSQSRVSDLPKSLQNMLKKDIEGPALQKALRNATPVFSDKYGTVAAIAKVGKGNIILLASPWSLSNTGIRRKGNLQFAVNALGDMNSGPVWFDEYHHGYGQSLLWALIPLPAKISIFNLILALLVWMYARSRRLGSPIPLDKGTRERSEFLGAMTGILRKGQATRLAIRTARDAAVRRLRTELGLPRDAGLRDITQAASRINTENAEQLKVALERCNAAVVAQEPPSEGVAMFLVKELDTAVKRVRMM